MSPPAIPLLLAIGILAGLSLCAEADKEVNPCDLPMVVGLCYASKPRYYYDKEAKKCREFKYGGCDDGNANNFETIEECQAKCQR